MDNTAHRKILMFLLSLVLMLNGPVFAGRNASSEKPTAKKFIFVGNWKMNKTIAEGLALAEALQTSPQLKDLGQKVEVVILPSHTAIGKIADFLRGSSIVAVGSQDVFWEESGSFTGAISPIMVKDAGAKYSLIGHSERRQLFQETDATVNLKIKAALRNGLIPILCVGETLAEREAGKVDTTIITQLQRGLAEITASEAATMLIAYEPVWAIGTGKAATPEETEAVGLTIRKWLTEKFGKRVAKKVRLLCSGSVKPSNSRALLEKPNIDGALIGGSSLKADEFIKIIANIP